jgi:hypothetical protein
MAEVHRGGCVCGSIRYRVQGEPVRAYVCHCTFCQRFTGSAFSVITWFNEENVEITGDGIATYDHTVDDTNRWFRLHFCGRCGTTFMATEERQPGIRLIMVGTFDDPNWVQLKRSIWMRSAQKWVVMPDQLEQYEKGTQHGPPMLRP